MKKNYLIVGMGSIGAKHLKCLREIEPMANIIVWRQFHQDPSVPDGADSVVFDLESALAFSPVCAILANPSSMHISTAILLAKAGVNLLVEKPLSNSLNQVDELISICKKNNVVLMVAYILRFNPSLRAFREYIKNEKIGRVISFRSEVGQFLPEWRPNTDYKKSVSARKDLGGGVLLELSHELDYIRWVFGEVKTVSALIINSGVLDIDVEDLVEVIMEINSSDCSSIVGSIHLNMLQRSPCRICHVIGEGGELEWDGLKNTVRFFNGAKKHWEIIPHNKTTNSNILFQDQIKSLLEAVDLKKKPLIDGHDGKSVIQIIEGIRNAARLERKVVL